QPGLHLAHVGEDAVGGALGREVGQALADALVPAGLVPVLDLLPLVAGAEAVEQFAGIRDAFFLVGEVLQQAVQLGVGVAEPAGLGEEVADAHALGGDLGGLVLGRLLPGAGGAEQLDDRLGVPLARQVGAAPAELGDGIDAGVVRRQGGEPLD